MASPSSRPTARSRNGGRTAGSSGSNSQQPMILGGIAVAVVVVVVLMMNAGPDKASEKEAPKSPAPASQPAAPAPVPKAAAKAGLAPKRPAPPLTQETLGKVADLTRTAEGYYNEGVTARTAGDNSTARDKQAQAKEVLDQIDKMLEAPLLWQEEAQMENWAQPAEYIQLEKVYGKASSLTKKVRMGGGK